MKKSNVEVNADINNTLPFSPILRNSATSLDSIPYCPHSKSHKLADGTGCFNRNYLSFSQRALVFHWVLSSSALSDDVYCPSIFKWLWRQS